MEFSDYYPAVNVPVDAADGRLPAIGPKLIVDRPTGWPADLAAAIDAAVTGGNQPCALGRMAALMVIQIDNMAMIVSGYGARIAEDAVAALSRQIRSFLTPADHFCRLQKDQFGIVLSESTREEIQFLSERIAATIQQFGYYADQGSLHVVPSLVCIELCGEGVNGEEALDQAFVALSHHQGIVHQTFEQNQLDAVNSRHEMGLANFLTKAIRERRLRMAFQPIIDSTTGEVAHYEALLRIVGHDGKISSAGPLIPIAERMGLIGIIDELVLDLVTDELSKSPDVCLAFNVSSLTTGSKQWLHRLKQRTEEYPGIAERLIVEITETAVHRDLKKTAFFVAAIQSLGCLVALDDFGSGYTSFRQLKSLSVDMVKIDGAFVRDLVDNHDNRLFVKTMLDFTNGFGLKAVAEFVENGEIAKLLMELGVSYLQGYYFGKPENHRSWLKQ